MKLITINRLLEEKTDKKINADLLDQYMTDNFYELLETLSEYGFEVRIVGGAVRDFLNKKEPRDIDLATDASPIELIYIFQEKEYTYSTKGIAHGTIIVDFGNEESYEITALGFRVKESGKRLETSFQRSWLEDAKQRDFTVNSLSMDFEGNVYDYSNGIKDIKNKYIRMIGDPFDRIPEHPELIIRFFKVLTSFKDAKYDDDIIEAILANIDLINEIHPKWLRKMLVAILNGKYPEKSKKMMKEYGILEELKAIAEKAHEANEELDTEEEMELIKNAMVNRKRAVNAYRISHSPFSATKGTNEFNRY